jgi:arabinan endo-1,5-alpha-L-arabinosidase
VIPRLRARRARPLRAPAPLAAAVLLAACGGPAGAPDAPTEDASPLADSPPDTGPGAPRTIEVAGAIAPVHDPALIWTGVRYLLLATGTGLPVRTSIDLVNWSLGGQVFAARPAWITTTDPSRPDDLWAPDLSYFGGRYHLYYAASRFGSNTSCIGHAVAATLEPPAWEDRGAVVCSTSSDDWNAIDPAVVVDAGGAAWLSFGSFWSGVKLIPLDGGGARLGASMTSLSTRANTAVEAPFLVRRGGFYYLFESVDFCCQGAASTYKVMVGRAASLQGPYVDRDGVPLLSGGGTLVVTGDGRWRGPGHNAVIQTPTGDYNVYHSYDAQAGGAPTLRVAELRWSPDGWPISAGP